MCSEPKPSAITLVVQFTCFLLSELSDSALYIVRLGEAITSPQYAQLAATELTRSATRAALLNIWPQDSGGDSANCVRVLPCVFIEFSK